MLNMSFSQKVLCKALRSRRLLCNSVQNSHANALLAANKTAKTDWNILLGDNLLFDLPGLESVSAAIQAYRGTATSLSFRLVLSREALRDYYSHNIFLKEERDYGVSDRETDNKTQFVELPIKALKKSAIKKQNQKTDTLYIKLDELTTPIHYPLALSKPDKNSTPLALLMPYSCDHDCLFANQIAIFSNLNQQLKSAFFSWLRGAFSRRKIGLKRRIALSWKQIHSKAEIHPTAIIEGSVIGAGCRIGAHCVVRYSVLGENVVLNDGAKVEYSVIDDNSWLMHDLVLYRSLLESNVFLIHGPYQFSFFQHQSAAFANIMMDYRPDNRPIKIKTPYGIRDYQGRFLGALLEEKAKVFGGTLTAPGITIPAGKEIFCDKAAITTAKQMKDF